LFSIGAASAAGVRELYTAPPRPRSSAWAFAGSRKRVVALRSATHSISCMLPGECSPVRGGLLAGPADGPLERAVRTPERMPDTARCRRRVAQLDDDFNLSVSGVRVAYARRVRCLSAHPRGRSQVVVRNLRTGAVRVVHRGRTSDVQLAGRFLAFEPARRTNRVVVVDLRTGRVVYRARAEGSSLGSDGTLATATFSGISFRGRLAWYSPDSPRRHVLPNRVSVFNAAPLVYADGKIAFVRRYDFQGGGELAVTDLAGNEFVHAAFAAPERLDAFAFDGTRLAFAHTRYRPDAGQADDGLRALCVDDKLVVPASATVIEVHAVTDATRMPAAQLPQAPPYRSASTGRPECPETD
jgi:hypothetical protein